MSSGRRSDMTATNAQVSIMMRERQKGKSLEQAAASANVRSRKTVAKYERAALAQANRAAPQLSHAPRSVWRALVSGGGHAGGYARVGSESALWLAVRATSEQLSGRTSTHFPAPGE